MSYQSSGSYKNHKTIPAGYLFLAMLITIGIVGCFTVNILKQESSLKLYKWHVMFSDITSSSPIRDQDIQFFSDPKCTQIITDISFPNVEKDQKVNSTTFYIKSMSKNSKVYWSWISSGMPEGITLTLRSSRLTKKGKETIYTENTLFELSPGEVISVHWNADVGQAPIGDFSWICNFSVYSSQKS